MNMNGYPLEALLTSVLWLILYTFSSQIYFEYFVVFSLWLVLQELVNLDKKYI